MNVWQNCTQSDTKDAVPLFASRGLYLKPVALLHVSVQLPQLKAHGKAISNWEIMEKLKFWIEPEKFISLKVSKSTLEFVRLDGEITNKWNLKQVLGRLDGRSIKLSGFSQQLKVRAVEAKCEFPAKHDWDTFFRDSKDMNEMKAGERPDTVYLGNLPCGWFKCRQAPSAATTPTPSEKLLKKIFEQFGEVKRIDIPMLDPYRNCMNSNISGVKQFTFNKNVIFECYVQFKEYFCFVKCMDAFRGMKLLYIDDEKKCYTASIKVDFDKTKHLSDASIQRRQIVRERLEKKEMQRLANEMKDREDKKKTENEERLKKLERRKMREQKRKERQIEKLKLKELEDMNKKIAAEEYLLLMAQRKLESIRLLGELINRIKNEKEKELTSLEKCASKKRKLDDEKVHDHSTKESDEKVNLDAEKDLRYKLIRKFKEMKQQKLMKEEMKLKSIVSDRSKLSNKDEDLVPVSLDSSSDVGEDSRLENENGKYAVRGRQANFGRQPARKYWQNNRGCGDDRSYFNDANSGGQQDDFQTRRGRYNRGGRRGFGRQAYANNWRGGGLYPNRSNHYLNPYMMPIVDPVLLTYSHEYYKYLQKMARESKRSRGNSPSSDRYSRSRSRSYSRSRSRSRSRSWSRSRSRSRVRSYTRSRSRSYSRSYSRSRSRSRGRSRTRTRSRSRCESKSRNGQISREQSTNAATKSTETNNVHVPDEEKTNNAKVDDVADGGSPKSSTKKRKKHKKKEKKRKRKSHDRKS